MDFAGDEFGLRPGLQFLDKGEEGLAVDLVWADEADDDSGVADIGKP